MEYKQNKSYICFVFILVQILLTISAPLNSLTEENIIKNIYKRSSIGYEEHEYAVYFEKPDYWGDVIYSYVYSDYVNELTYNAGRPLKPWPGERMEFLKNSNKYYSKYAAKYYNHNSYIIFTDGEHQVPSALEKGFILNKGGIYNIDGLVSVYDRYDSQTGSIITKKDIVDIFYDGQELDRIYIHYKIGNKSWNKLPGELLKRSYFEKNFSLRIDLNGEEEITFAFTDGNNHWDNNAGKNYKMKALEDGIFGNNLNLN